MPVTQWIRVFDYKKFYMLNEIICFCLANINVALFCVCSFSKFIYLFSICTCQLANKIVQFSKLYWSWTEFLAVCGGAWFNFTSEMYIDFYFLLFFFLFWTDGQPLFYFWARPLFIFSWLDICTVFKASLNWIQIQGCIRMVFHLNFIVGGVSGLTFIWTLLLVGCLV